MTDSSDKCSFYVPSFIKRTFGGLLLPGQELEEIFDQIGGLLLEESNEIRPDKTVWGSEVMTLNKKKPRTLDTFFDKIIKTETSDVDSNCSMNSNDESVMVDSSKINNIKSSPDSTPQILSPKKSNQILTSKNNVPVTTTNKLKVEMNKSKSRRHSISSSEDESAEANVKNSPTHSVDLFSEDIQKTDHPNKTNTEYSLSDDEIIPSSQVHQSSNRLSLGSLTKKSPTKTSSKSNQYSEIAREPIYKKSNVQNTKGKETSSSEEDELNQEPTLSKLDAIKNSMKNIKEVFSEIESNDEKFSFGDLTEDDELYILQCPSEIDCQNLKGVELTLQGNSVISIDDGNKYDCFSIKGDSKRYLYVALPDNNKKEMKLGVFRLAGNIILSENLDIPFTKAIEDNDYDNLLNTNNELPKDEMSRKQKSIRDNSAKNASLEISNVSQCEELPGQHILKKKKKHKNTNDTSLDESVPCESHCEDVSNVLEQLSPKKKKRKHSSLESNDIDSSFSRLENVSGVETGGEDSQIIPGTQDQETPLKIKKKKKRSKEEGISLNTSFSESEVPKLKTEWEDSQIIPDTQDQETPSKVKKKKRKSKEDNTQGTETETEYFSENVKEVLNELALKKKKRRHYSLESNESTDNKSNFDNFLNIKTEWEEPQVVSDFPETPSKSKKRSRKDMEDSEEISVEVPKKKKKKKHSHSESQDTL